MMGIKKVKFLAEATRAYRAGVYPRFQQCKRKSGEPPPGQDTSLSLVYLPQQARYPFTAGQTEEFSGHKDFRPCRDLNPRPSDLQANVLPLSHIPSYTTSGSFKKGWLQVQPFGNLFHAMESNLIYQLIITPSNKMSIKQGSVCVKLFL